MNILNLNWYKTATISLSVPTTKPTNIQFDDILSIAYSLNNLLWSQWLNDKYSQNYWKEFHITIPKSETITIDGNSISSTTSGIINFYLDGIPNEKIQPILNNISHYLSNNQVIIGKFSKETSKLFNVPVIRIPILKNPKYFDKFDQNRTPDVTFSNANAYHLFNVVLKYNRSDLIQDNAFDPNELIKRIQYFKGEPIPEGEFAGQPYIEISPESLSNPDNLDYFTGKSAPSNLSKNMIIQRLDNISDFCKWAIENGYNQIYLV